MAPYSEHSSYEELGQMVQWLRPALMVPTVVPKGDTDIDGVQRLGAAACS